MITVTRLEDLGHFRNDWLEARYHFSFSSYQDPERMGWGALRVWNDDTIQPGGGFAPHSHRDMEIVTYLRQGAITHEDGVTTLFQIWIEPARLAIEPRWETREFLKDAGQGRLHALASGRQDDDGALKIHQDAAVMGATLKPGEEAVHPLPGGRRAYLVPARGSIEINGTEAPERAGVQVTDEEQIVIKALTAAEVVLVDVA